jgi:hypothetical protein
MGDLKTVVLVLGCAANLLLVAGILWWHRQLAGPALKSYRPT